jgi:hypothetical protein
MRFESRPYLDTLRSVNLSFGEMKLLEHPNYIGGSLRISRRSTLAKRSVDFFRVLVRVE